MNNTQVILVDKNDVSIGVMEKLEAHIKGELHRAFSIFVFNSDGKLLVQKRAFNKYHSGGLWTNTCCSHPQPSEDLNDSVQKRLQEEMGFSCTLQKAFHLLYKAELDNELTEHEIDHIFIGHYDENPKINFHEVAEWKYESVNLLQQNIKLNPKQYTAWFKIIFPKVLEYL